MEKTNQKIPALFLVSGSLALLFLAIFLFLKSPLFRVTLTQKEIHIEAGTKADTNPHTYLDGADWCVALSHVDTSSVKHTKVGRYPIYISHGFEKYIAYVNVIDTTSPVVSSSVKNKTLIPGTVISAKNLGLNIKDYSEIQTIQFTKIASDKFLTGLPEEQSAAIREAYRKGIAIKADDFQFAYSGIYTLTISVQDIFYNTSEIELVVTVEEPPVIEVSNDFYIAGSSQIDFSQYITVWDFIDGDVSVENVEIDTSQLKPSNSGTYPVIFSATDDYGLTATKTVKVHVTSQNALQELINTHVIHPDTSTIIGARNPYDSGYYPSATADFIKDSMEPTIVTIQTNTPAISNKGFVIEINDQFVTIATTAQSAPNTLSADVTFWDGITCNGAIVSAHPELNMAFLRIPIKDMAENTPSALCRTYAKTLRTVHINKNYWEQHKDTLQTITSIPASGAPIFDTAGRLVGIYKNDKVSVPLDKLLGYFEAIFKYKIHYQ